MKKISFLILLFFPIFVSASLRFDVTDLLIDSYILEDGSMYVQELIVLDGTFSSFSKDIIYKNSNLNYHNPIDFKKDAIYNGSNIYDVSIKAKKITHNDINFKTFFETFETLEKKYYKEDAKNKEYVEKSIRDGKSYEMYYESQNETVAFLIEYKVADVVVLHQDIAEIYWPFLNDSFDEEIENFMIHVTLPKKDESNKVFAFLHGDIIGKLTNMNHQTIEASMKKLPRYNEVSLRMTFDPNILNKERIKKQSNIFALESIEEIENYRIKTESTTYQNKKRIHKVIFSISSIYFLSILFWWIYVYFKYDREYKTNYQEKYNQDIIQDYTSPVVEELVNHEITANSFISSFLNLIDKKNIKVIKNQEKIIEFQLQHKKNITTTEEVLLDFLFEKVSNKKHLTWNDFKEYAVNKKTAKMFYIQYENWFRCVQKDCDREKFYESHGLPIISSIFLLLFAIFIAFATIYFEISLLIPWFSFILGVLFFLYSTNVKKKTKKGVEHLARWNAFYNFLKDFETLNDLPKEKLWNRYLAYGTLFGLEEKLENVMKNKAKKKNEWLETSLASNVSTTFKEAIAKNKEIVKKEQI